MKNRSESLAEVAYMRFWQQNDKISTVCKKVVKAVQEWHDRIIMILISMLCA